MPFGLTNGPIVGQTEVENVLRLPRGWVVDDGRCCGLRNLFTQYQKRLSTVLTCFNSANLKLDPTKFSFAKPKVSFLGHCVASGGIRPDPAWFDTIAKYPNRGFVSSLRSMLGLFS